MKESVLCFTERKKALVCYTFKLPARTKTMLGLNR